MRSAVLPLRLIAAVLIAATVPAEAWTVSGHIRDGNGAGIAGVDLDFEDQNTGTIIVTPNDNTDVSGFYSTTVPTGNYRIFFNPPAGQPYFADKDDRSIGGNTVVDRTLVQGVFVSGYVEDEFGTGLFGVDLNFYNALTGENLGYSGDNTDPAGFYRVLVDQGMTFDILYRPSPGDPHVAAEVAGVPAGATEVLMPDVVLASGHFVTGFVRRKGTTTPVPGTDIDAVNTATGEKISRLGFDNTDAAGNWQVVLRPGVWDIIASPPGGSGLAAEIRPGVSVSASTPVGLIELAVGFAVGGTVNGPGGALSGVNVDPIDRARNLESPTSGDHTGATGQYGMTLAAAAYDVIFWPPAGQPLAAFVLKNQVVTGNTALPTVTLPAGFAVTGIVRTASGLPVLDADINAEQIADGFSYPLPSDNSRGDGTYAIRVPGDTYRMIATPPAGSGLRPDTVIVALGSNRVIDFSLDPNGIVGVPEIPSNDGGLRLRSESANPGRGPFHFSALSFDESGGFLALRVYSVDGRIRRRLFEGMLTGDAHHFEWDARDDAGQPVPAGVYYVQAVAARGRAVLPLVLSR